MIICLPNWDLQALTMVHFLKGLEETVLSKENICRAIRGMQQQNQSFDSPPHAAFFEVSSRLQLIWQPKKSGFASSTWCLKG